MKIFTTIGKLAAVATFISLLATPALAELVVTRDHHREPAITRIAKLAKRFFGIWSTGDYPTVPKP
ncbi:MAG TPA: hypothetical protein VEK11_13000 [Thermoanaerobaculia bacterium]|jgi:hypothetical protein|nr:hypothetical protein [Thermoanaerobaculia bacterium]